MSFVVSVPMADVWQDDAWRDQQLRLLTAQFGPKEVNPHCLCFPQNIILNSGNVDLLL